MPDTESRTTTTHPMDPRRGESLSPMFQAFLCWLLDLHAHDGARDHRNRGHGGQRPRRHRYRSVSSTRIIGSLTDFERNIRGWGEACGADPATIEGLVTKASGRRDGPDRQFIRAAPR